MNIDLRAHKQPDNYSDALYSVHEQLQWAEYFTVRYPHNNTARMLFAFWVYAYNRIINEAPANVS